jgi:hypothetical protein
MSLRATVSRVWCIRRATCNQSVQTCARRKRFILAWIRQPGQLDAVSDGGGYLTNDTHSQDRTQQDEKICSTISGQSGGISLRVGSGTRSRAEMWLMRFSVEVEDGSVKTRYLRAG